MSEPDYDAMADRAREGFDMLKADIESLEQKGEKISKLHKMTLNSFGDIITAAFTLKPKETAQYARKMSAILDYILGYTDSPLEQ